ncbi:MAG: hypothetical protein OEU32_18175 [Acidimicrobiia bacterium]|nr:hypothetical protein [Acidimicrobiia bacterium]
MGKFWALFAVGILVGSMTIGATAGAQDGGDVPVGQADQNEAPAGPGSNLSGRLTGSNLEHTCAVLDSGALRCWGSNADGQLGYGNTIDVGDGLGPNVAAAGPVALGAGRTTTALTAGADHTCALLDNATVRCWGFNDAGELGTNSLADPKAPAPPVDFGLERTAVQITAGDDHTCVILDDGSLRCFGENADGQLGYGNTIDVGDGLGPTVAAVGPVDLGPGRTALAVSGGVDHTCALLDNGTVRCWGRNDGGELGTDDANDYEAPAPAVDFGPGRTAIAITTGDEHTCALLDDHSVRCFGENDEGQLGYDNTTQVGDGVGPDVADAGPVALGPGRTAMAISGGGDHTCALLDNSWVRCWGRNDEGQLGYGNITDVGDGIGPDVALAGPVQFGPGRTATDVTAGYRHSCAAFTDGTITCWGDGGNGRLGYGNTTGVGDGVGPSVAAAGVVDIGGGFSLAPGAPSGLGVPLPSGTEGKTLTVSWSEPAESVFDSPIVSYEVSAGGASAVVTASGDLGAAAVRTVTLTGVNRSVAQTVTVEATTVAGRSTAASVVAPALQSRIFVSNVIASGPAEYDFVFAPPGAAVVTGDWTGDGNTGFASRTGNVFTLVDERGNPQGSAGYGKPTDEIFIGDWSANNQDTFAVRRGNVFFLRNTPTSGNADIILGYGRAADEVFVGDWNGNGQDTFAVRRGNVFFVRNSTTTGIADIVFGFGQAADDVLVGDWDQDGVDTFAVRRGKLIFIRNDFQTGIAEQTIAYGIASDQLLVGDFDADGVDTFAVRRLEPTT